MAKKDPVRGMQPMDEYSRDSSDRSTLNKALEAAGSAAGLGVVAGIPAYMLSKSRKKQPALKDEDGKSGIALDAENIKKDQQLKKESEAYEKSKGMKKGGKVSSASARADGIAQRGKTKGKIV